MLHDNLCFVYYYPQEWVWVERIEELFQYLQQVQALRLHHLCYALMSTSCKYMAGVLYPGH